MNEKFYELPKEKQLRIINAGMEVFAKHDYKHAITDDIATKAGISKGLLFYYFHNKKALYITLYQYSVETMRLYVQDEAFSHITDFFDLISYAARQKYTLLQRTPYITDFMLRAYAANDDMISDEMKQQMQQTLGEVYTLYFQDIDYSKFKPGIDPQEVLRMLIWMGEGYMVEHNRAQQPFDMSDLMQNFNKWLPMFRQYAYKEEFHDGH